MKIIKLEHSGLVLDKQGKKLVFDPVEIAESLPELDEVVAVVITHKHGDHYQPESLKKVLARSVDARVFVPEDMADEIPGSEVMRPGDAVSLDDFQLNFFGGEHANILPGVVPCQDLGVVVDGWFVNPGDSLIVPSGVKMPRVLCVPTAAPFLKTCEAMSYIEVMQPEMVIPVHDAVLSSFGKNIYNGWLGSVCQKVNAELKVLDTNESVLVDETE